MDDKPPPYVASPNTPDPSAPPAYSQSLPGPETKGIDWSLNTTTDNRDHHGNHSRPAPSAPAFSEVRVGSSTKGIDWSLNQPDSSYRPVYPGEQPAQGSHHEQPAQGSHPSYHTATGSHRSQSYPSTPGQGISRQTPEQTSTVQGIYPAVPNTTVPRDPANPFTRWKTEFSRHYPGARLSRDTPSIMQVEIPKNRAFPVLGHATCPECFDHGPHQTSTLKKKDGFLSTKKFPTQKCRRCFKLTYFIHSTAVVPDQTPVDRPPPYLCNRPSQIGFNAYTRHGPLSDAMSTQGHGWGDRDEGHGWDPGEGEGHGWGRY